MTRLRLFFALAIACFIAPTPVHAAGAEFTVAPIAQGSQEPGYLKYTLASGQAQPTGVWLTNNADHARQFTMQLIPAGVGSSGQLFYTPGARLVADRGPKLAAMADQAKQTVTLAAHERRQLTTTLRVPQTPFVGERLGAFYINAHPDKQQGDGGIQNQFAMSMPLHVTIAHALTTRPQLSLHRARLAADSTTPTITADLRNHSPRLFGQITMKTQIVNAQGKTVARQVLADTQMAPSAIMPLQVPSQKLAPGTYRMRVHLTSGKQAYHLENRFTISGAQLAAATPHTTSKSPLAWWVYALIGLVFALLAMIGWLLWQRRKDR